MLFAELFAKKYFLEDSWKADKSAEPIDVILTASQGAIALELTVIATNPEGHKRKSYTELVISELQGRLRQDGIKELHFCLQFRPDAQNRFPKRSDAVSVLADFIVRNIPVNMHFPEIRNLNISHSERAYELVDFIEVQMDAGLETNLCQVGTIWAGGLRKELVQEIIDGKNRVLPEKRRLHPDIPHWLIMVIENHEGSSAAFWEEHANDTFHFDYDACFILELAPPKYIQLRRAGAN